MGEKVSLEYVGVAAMSCVALALWAMQLGLGHRLQERARRREGTQRSRSASVDVDPDSPLERTPGDAAQADKATRPLDRYFLAAALGVVLQSASIFLYVWSVSLDGTGLTGFVAIVCFASCLLVGLVYVWSRGATEVASDRS